MGDVFVVGVAGPGHVLLAGFEGGAHRVEAGDEFAVVAERLEDLGADAGHDAHVDHDIDGVGQLDADFGAGRADGAHAEGDDIHGASAHAAVVELAHGGLEFDGVAPVVVGAGFARIGGADEGAVFHAGDIGGVGHDQEGVGALGLIQGDEGAILDGLGAEALVFLLGAVAPIDGVGLAQFGGFVDPVQQGLVVGFHIGSCRRQGVGLRRSR